MRYCNFRLALAFALTIFAPAQLLAQTAPGSGVPPGGVPPSSITLPGSSGQTCVQVEIAGQKPSAYNCLNQELQQDVQGSSRPQASSPLSATSQSNQVGTFNERGVAEQYGQNFGKSVTPYRPPPPVYGSSLGTPR